MNADASAAPAGPPPANGARRLATPDPDMPRLTFTFDGRAIPAFEGETIAAALVAAGVTRFRTTRSGAARAPFCGMGVCFDCIVTIDGRPGQRACLAKATDGLVVTSATDAARLAPLADSVDAVETRQVDVLVVGAGPAGLAAARDLATAGASVLVVDERPQPGGQYYKPLATPWRGPQTARDRRFRDGEALVEAARAAGAAFWPSTVAWAAFAADDVHVLRDGVTPVRIAPRALVLATGAYERIDPFPGWTLPAVTTIGGLQTLVRSYRVAPGRRIILAGNGPLVLQTAADCLDAGLPPLAVVERARLPWSRPVTGLKAAFAAPRLLWDGLRLIARLRRAGVLMFWDSDVAEVERVDGLARVTILHRDVGLQLETDLLAVGHGFHGQSDLARQLGCRMRASERFGGTLEIETDAHGETSVANVFAIGDAVALRGAPIALTMGRIAAGRIAERLGFRAVDGVAAARRVRARTDWAQSALWRLFAAPDRPVLDDDAIICRCEEVTAAAVREVLARAADPSLALVKRHTRAGMGRCQGRYCAPVIARLVAEAGGPPLGPLGLFAPRPPARPAPLPALAREQPEWGGHREEVPPPLTPQPERRRDFGAIAADVAVIGAGIVGACVARELAERGMSVVVLERDEPNLAASGANAGSLHVQLLSFDFGAKAQAGGGPAAATLRLGPPSVALWREIERAAREDLEIVTSGGLMVAETREELAFLEAKTALERAHGVDSRVIGAGELFALEPNLAPHLVGAAWCPGEGKINPLLATYAVIRLAQRAGARFESRADVLAIEREADGGWLLTTAAGRVRAGRVVNCAGGWASRVAALVGRPIPVKGAPLQMIVTEPGPPLLKSLIAHGGRHLSLKQAAAGGLIIGGGWPAALDPATGASRPLLASIEGNAFVACRVLPKAASFHAIRIWAGMNVNIDGAPILGEMPGAPGFFNCVTSNGYTLAPIVARLTAQLLASEATELAVGEFGLQRFG